MEIWSESKQDFVTGPEAVFILQTMPIPELKKNIEEHNSWHGFVDMSGGKPIDASPQIKMFEDELARRGQL